MACFEDPAMKAPHLIRCTKLQRKPMDLNNISTGTRVVVELHQLKVNKKVRICNEKAGAEVEG